MKYYVFETELVSGQQAFLTTPKDSYEQACGLYHQILASCYANSNLTYALVMIIDEQGNVVNRTGIDRRTADIVEETVEE